MQIVFLAMYLLESSCIGHSGPINSVTFNHDGDLIASGGMSSLWFITTLEAELIKYPTGDDGHLMVWKCENGECMHNIAIGSPQSPLGYQINTSHEKKASAIFGLPRWFNTSLPCRSPTTNGMSKS